MWNAEFSDELVKGEVGDDLCESIILVDELGDLCFIGSTVDFIVAVILFDKVDHSEEYIALF